MTLILAMTRPKHIHILIVNPFFPPWAPGGAEHSLEQLCNRFFHQGWGVKVIAVSLDGRAGEEARDGYVVHWVPATDRVPPGQDIPDIPYLRSTRYLNDVWSAFKKFPRKPNVLIANNAQSNIAAANLAGKSGIPAIAIVRDTQMLCEPGTCMDNTPTSKARPCSGYFGSGWCNIRFHRVRGERGLRPWPAWFVEGMRLHRRRLSLRHAVRQFSTLVTISDSLRLLIRKILPAYPEERITTIRNLPTIVPSVTPEEVRAFLTSRGLVKGKYFLFAGRKTYGKGADLAVHAIRIVREHETDLRLILAGRGNVEGRNMVGVVDEPSVSQSMLMALLGKAIALLIPGRWQEGLHRTMIDALRLGVPIICSQSGAPPVEGVIDGRNGYVVPCNDPAALAKVMMDIAGWGQARRNVSRRQAQVLFQERFSNGVIMKQWERVLDLVIQPKETKHGLA